MGCNTSRQQLQACPPQQHEEGSPTLLAQPTCEGCPEGPRDSSEKRPAPAAVPEAVVEAPVGASNQPHAEDAQHNEADDLPQAADDVEVKAVCPGVDGVSAKMAAVFSRLQSRLQSCNPSMTERDNVEEN
mmetsp:Transcript_42307/g.92160  ORF Transcript_42307/g.92160 Transcript_42307/m.92160 type:complete len:130 (-) Transcript_42307:219-608(-)